MSDREIALQITLKAIESGMIYKGRSENGVSDANEKTANEIGKFYTIVYKAVGKIDED